MVTFDKQLVEEAKGIVAIALLNGPLMGSSRGARCPVCSDEDGFAKLSDAEVKAIAKEATSRVFRLLWLRDNEPERYQRELERGSRGEVAGASGQPTYEQKPNDETCDADDEHDPE
jgi:hypothetical protein